MDQAEIAIITIGFVLPFLSIAFLGMGMARSLCDSAPVASKRLIRRSLSAYGLYWLTALVSCLLQPKSDLVTGDIFLAVTLPPVLLIASVYFGLKSRAAAGRRVAMASASMIGVYMIYGEIFYLGMAGKPIL